MTGTGWPNLFSTHGKKAAKKKKEADNSNNNMSCGNIKYLLLLIGHGCCYCCCSSDDTQLWSELRFVFSLLSHSLLLRVYRCCPLGDVAFIAYDGEWKKQERIRINNKIQRQHTTHEWVFSFCRWCHPPNLPGDRPEGVTRFFFFSSFKSPHTTIPNQPTNQRTRHRERKTRVVIHTRTQHEANGKEKGGRERKASIKRSSPKLVRVLSTRCCRLLLLLLLLHSSFYHNFFFLSLSSLSVCIARSILHAHPKLPSLFAFDALVSSESHDNIIERNVTITYLAGCHRHHLHPMYSTQPRPRWWWFASTLFFFSCSCAGFHFAFAVIWKTLPTLFLFYKWL